MRASRAVAVHQPSKVKGYYTVEQDLDHHIREAFVSLSTETVISFFANPYVRDWLWFLNNAHKPIYQLKYLRLLQVIIYILNREISLIMQELYLLYGEDFVASTSDFWWRKYQNQSFGACNCNFMANKYTLQNGMQMFMSDTTLGSLSSDEDPRGWVKVLRSKKPTLARCTSNQLLCYLICHTLELRLVLGWRMIMRLLAASHR